jgi:ElaB/YqjD/DUF883 family membrane-anchored ribosome-binding protein
MDNEAEVIRQQMDETRSNLQDKLEILEQQVTDHVQGAAEAASETVQTVKDAVQDTVETVRETVEQTVNSMEQTVQSVKDTFDLRRQVREHPCIMFFGAAALGFVGTRFLYPPAPAPANVDFNPPNPPSPPAKPARVQHNGVRSSPPAPAGFFAQLAEQYHDEIAQVKGLAVGAVANVVREMITSAAAPALGRQIAEILDSVTVKLGGKPIPGDAFQTTGESGCDKGDTVEQYGTAKNRM